MGLPQHRGAGRDSGVISTRRQDDLEIANEVKRLLPKASEYATRPTPVPRSRTKDGNLDQDYLIQCRCGKPKTKRAKRCLECYSTQKRARRQGRRVRTPMSKPEPHVSSTSVLHPNLHRHQGLLGTRREAKAPRPEHAIYARNGPKKKPPIVPMEHPRWCAVAMEHDRCRNGTSCVRDGWNYHECYLEEHC